MTIGKVCNAHLRKNAIMHNNDQRPSLTAAVAVTVLCE